MLPDVPGTLLKSEVYFDKGKWIAFLVKIVGILITWKFKEKGGVGNYNEEKESVNSCYMAKPKCLL